jgi:fructose-bisphosphate aldolase class II
MLINMKKMLTVAKDNHFAVPAFNISSNMLLQGVIETCEKFNSPVILEIHPNELNFVGDAFAKYVVEVAKTNSNIPITVHLDHGANFAQCVRAIQDGFTSVMIDASQKDFDENVALTSKVVDMAHCVDVSVEAELGTIGPTVEGGIACTDDIIYTRPEDVRLFAQKTGVDSLAIAIGTAHGLYPKNKQPKLRIDILREIRAITDIPLVLHGGSDNNDAEIAEAVRCGIQKINISSDIKSAFYDKCRIVLQDKILREPNKIYPPCIAEMEKVVEHKLRLFNDIDKAGCYR